jgi:hypothetical protein
MTRSSRLAVTLVAAAVLLAPPAPASADDQAVWSAYNSHSPVLHDAIHAYVRAGRRARARPSRTRRVRVWIRTGQRIREVVALVADEVRAEEPSSGAGRQAKSLALHSLRDWRASLAIQRKALRLYLRGRDRRSLHFGRLAVRTFDRSKRLDKRALRAFREAGIDTSPRGPR